MKRFVLSRRYLLLVTALIVSVFVWYTQSTKNVLPEGVEVGVVERGMVEEVINETGFVKVSRAVDLAFERTGRVERVLVDEGSVVEEGQDLVVLDDSSQGSDLVAARARLEAEQVRLEEILTGADSVSRAVTESSVASAAVALENAKRNLTEVTTQYEQLVANAEKTLRSSSLQAYLVSDENENSTRSYAAPTITGTYTSDEEGVYRLELYNSDAPSGASLRVSGLETDTQAVSTVSSVAIGTRGLRVQFPEDFAKHTLWEIPVPNTHSSTYLVNMNAYNAAIESRDLAIANAESAVKSGEAALAQARVQLTQVSSSGREERVTAQRALVRQMEVLVAQAERAHDNTVITAPFSGVVTSLSAEIGQIVPGGAPVASLIGSGTYELTVDISEVDIAEVSVGDPAVATFDAYDDITFNAHVSKIAPNATVVSGVRVFTVTLTFDAENELIKDGLTAQIDITTATQENVIAIPTRAIYENAEGKFVRTVTDDGVLGEISITTGLRGTNGMTEIVSGLNEGVRIITFASEEAIAQIKQN